MILARRSFLAGLASSLAAPAIVRASSLMPVRSVRDYSPVYVNLTAKHLSDVARLIGPDPIAFINIEKAIEHYLKLMGDGASLHSRRGDLGLGPSGALGGMPLVPFPTASP